VSQEVKAERRRILLVIAGLGPGGAERQMTLLALELDRNRYEVGLLIFNAEERVHYQDIFERPLWFRALGLSRHRSGRISLTFDMVQGIRRAVADFQPDLIHTSLHVANVIVRISGLLFFSNIPVVTSIRCNFLKLYSKLDQFIEKLLCHRSAAIIVNSDTIRHQLINALRLPLSAVITVNNGIDIRFSPGVDTRPEGWPNHGRVALVVGRLTEEKNHLAMIEALRKLDKVGQIDDWNFVLVGEGQLQSRIEEAIANFPRFTLLPPTNNLLPYYRNADLLILPSLHEGMSNVALEAQACGVPVALTPAANNGGVVSEDKGWLLNGCMIEALASVLSQPVETMRRRGVASQEDVCARFGVERMARKIEIIYDTCLNNPHVC